MHVNQGDNHLVRNGLRNYMEKLLVKGETTIPCRHGVVYTLRCSTHTDVVGLYTATGGEFGPPPLGAPCSPRRTL